jgi:KEOPS complex subunit Cgi121
MNSKDSNQTGPFTREPVEIHQVRMDITDLPGFLRDLRQVGTGCNCTIICFNRHVMAGRSHVLSAVNHALRSFDSGEQIARTIEVEALLYAAGTRQTGLIGPFGVHPGINECYLCIVPPTPGAADRLKDLVSSAAEEDWEIITPDKQTRLCGLFGITDKELEVTGRDRIPDIILERVTLLTVNR